MGLSAAAAPLWTSGSRVPPVRTLPPCCWRGLSGAAASAHAATVLLAVTVWSGRQCARCHRAAGGDCLERPPVRTLPPCCWRASAHAATVLLAGEVGRGEERTLQEGGRRRRLLSP
jgi:hypothetical protein